MQAMFDKLAPRLARRPADQDASGAWSAAGEGRARRGLAAIAARYADVDIGSYPFYRPTGNGVAVVAKGMEPARLKSAIADVAELFTTLGYAPVAGEPAA